MPSWLTSMTIGQVALVVGCIGVVLGVIFRVWKTIRPVWRGIRDFLEDWRGEPAREGVPERPGVMRRLQAIEATTDRLDHEMHPNSGASLRDKVDSIETQLREHLAQQQG